MNVRDYRTESFLNEGTLYGLGVSVLVHLAVLGLALSAAWLMPSRDAPITLCTISLIDMQDADGGAGRQGCKLQPGEEEWKSGDLQGRFAHSICPNKERAVI
jgi:hypothetical protein